MKPIRYLTVLVLTLIILLFTFSGITAQGPTGHKQNVPSGGGGSSTAFTYQGQLKKNGNPVNDTCSMTFSLWDSQTGGTQIGINQWISGVSVSQGLFTVSLNAGNQFSGSGFTGDDRWLQTAVQCAGDASPVVLARQQVTATPYALGLKPGAIIKGPSNVGLETESTNSNGTGIVGVASTGSSAYGVWGVSNSGYGLVGEGSTGVLAGGNPSGANVALEIESGAIKATGADTDTNTFAFIHISCSYLCYGANTVINNVFTNGDQRAMLFVTHVYDPPGLAGNVFTHPFGVSYNAVNQKWQIYDETNTAMVYGFTFNVLVIKR